MPALPAVRDELLPPSPLPAPAAAAVRPLLRPGAWCCRCRRRWHRRLGPDWLCRSSPLPRAPAPAVPRRDWWQVFLLLLLSPSRVGQQIPKPYLYL